MLAGVAGSMANWLNPVAPFDESDMVAKRVRRVPPRQRLGILMSGTGNKGGEPRIMRYGTSWPYPDRLRAICVPIA